MAKLTQAGLTAIAKAVVDGSKQSIDASDYELTADAITGLIEKIARVEVADPEVVDTLDIFDAGQLESGADIELAFNELLAPEDADPTGATALAPRYPSLFKSYSKPLGVKDFVGTMPKLSYRKVLEGFLPIEEFASKVVSNIRKSKVAYKYGVKRQALAQMGENIHIAGKESTMETPLSKPIDETSSKAFVKRILEKISDFKFISQDNNCAGVLTSVSSTNVVVILRKDIMPTLSVMLYAGLRSPQYAGINVEIREVDNFGVDSSDDGTWDTTPGDTLACIADIRAMRLFTISDYTEEQLNAKGSFKTWFNHYDANLCLHPCANYHFIVDSGAVSVEVANVNVVNAKLGVEVANTTPIEVEVANTPLEVEVVEEPVQ